MGDHPSVLGFSGRRLIVVLDLEIAAGRIKEIHAIVDPAKVDFIGASLASLA